MLEQTCCYDRSSGRAGAAPATAALAMLQGGAPTSFATKPQALRRKLSGDAHLSNRSLPAELMALMLDEVGYSVVLLGAGQQLRYANYAAKQELHSLGSMGLYGEEAGSNAFAELRMHTCSAQLAFATACDKARLGQRAVLAFADTRGDLLITVLPLQDSGNPQLLGSVLVLIKRRLNYDEMGMKLFARSCGVTAAEYNVMQALCSGLRPKQVAFKLNVAATTVRSQIKSLRSKTGTRSVQELLQIISSLPPITPALRQLSS